MSYHASLLLLGVVWQSAALWKPKQLIQISADVQITQADEQILDGQSRTAQQNEDGHSRYTLKTYVRLDDPGGQPLNDPKTKRKHEVEEWLDPNLSLSSFHSNRTWPHVNDLKVPFNTTVASRTKASTDDIGRDEDVARKPSVMAGDYLMPDQFHKEKDHVVIANSSGIASVTGLGTSSQGLGFLVMGICWWFLHHLGLTEPACPKDAKSSSHVADSGDSAMLLRPFILAHVLPCLSLQDACSLDAASPAIRANSDWGWKLKFVILCEKLNIGESTVLHVKSKECAWRSRVKIVFQKSVSWIPLISLWDYLACHRVKIMMTVIPICLGSFTVLLLHALKCPSFDFTGGQPLTSFVSDVQGMIRNIPWLMAKHSASDYHNVAFWSLLNVLGLYFFALWFLALLAKACLGILWMVLQCCDSGLGSFGQWILLSPLHLDLAGHPSIGVFLGSLLTSIGLLVWALLVVFIAYDVVRRRTIRKRRELME